MSTKTAHEREQLLAALGLPTSGETLVPVAAVATTTPTRTPDAQPTVLVDPHHMPVDMIVLTPDMVDGFDLTDPDQRSQATQHVFRMFRSPKKGERNVALWAKVSPWVTGLARERRTHGVVKEAVKVDQPTRDLAAMLAASGMTAEVLAGLIQRHQAEQEG